MPQGKPVYSKSDNELLRVAARVEKLNDQIQKVAKTVAATVADRKKTAAKAKSPARRKG